MHQFLHRLRYAIAAFKVAKHTAGGPEYAVIYEAAEDNPYGEADETYYGYFRSPEQVYRMSNNAYPKPERDMALRSRTLNTWS